MGVVKIFCDCGKEIWAQMDKYDRDNATVKHLEETAECADCVMTRVLAQRTDKTRLI